MNFNRVAYFKNFYYLVPHENFFKGGNGKKGLQAGGGMRRLPSNDTLQRKISTLRPPPVWRT